MSHPSFLATQLVAKLNEFINRGENERLAITRMVLTQIQVDAPVDGVRYYEAEAPEVLDGEVFTFSYVFGLINGVLGVDANGVGYIGATFRPDDHVESFYVMKEEHRQIIANRRKDG